MAEIWSGVDVAKTSFEASWVEAEDRVEEFSQIAHRSFERSLRGVRAYLRWVDQHLRGRDLPVRVVMEATGRYSLELIAWLLAERPQLEPALVNPKQAHHFHKSLGLRNKTDAVDARSLGLMGQQRRPRAYEPLPPAYQSLRDLIRQRRAFVEMVVSENNRLSETPTSKAVHRALESHVRHLKKLIERLEKSLRQTIESCDRLQRDVELLCSLPGVGWIVAVTVLGELGDLRRYRRSRQVAAAAGLAPNNHQSGETHRPAHIDRNGSSELRAMLYLAALTACRSQNHRLARVYHHLIDDNHLSKRQALVALMRKTLVIGRALLIHNRPYDDHFADVTSS
jgi:transposase